jgi:protoporphyrinogen oxidase
LYRASNPEAVEIAVAALKRMFPEFDRDAIEKAHVWRADYAQPLVERHYSRLIPDFVTPVKDLFLSSMAQIYPEDRGTNYAVRNGCAAGKAIAEHLKRSHPKGNSLATAAASSL